MKKSVFLVLLALGFSPILADTYTHYDWTCLTKNNSPVSVNESVNNTQNYGSAKYYSNGGNGLPSNCIGKQTKQNYTMTIDNNGGSGGALKYNSDGSMYVSNPSRTGYTFTNWNTSNNNAPASKIPASFAGNVTYTANWVANTYSVNYNSNGGSGSMSASTATYNQPFKTKQNSFSRTGYTFNGWNESANGSGVAWALDSSGVYESGKSWTWNYAKDITLYAQWNANTYTVNYNSNGGSGSMSSDTATYGQGYTTKANGFTKNGYTFAGWNEKADGTGMDWTGWIGKPWTWSYTNGVTLYAQWAPNTYTITYNANGGSGGPSTQNFKYNSGEKISTSVPSRTGYDFVDWTYGGYHFKPGDAIPSEWGSFTLTANWKSKILYGYQDATGYSGSYQWSTPSYYKTGTVNYWSNYNYKTSSYSCNCHTVCTGPRVAGNPTCPNDDCDWRENAGGCWWHRDTGRSCDTCWNSTNANCGWTTAGSIEAAGCATGYGLNNRGTHQTATVYYPVTSWGSVQNCGTSQCASKSATRRLVKSNDNGATWNEY